jgi:type II secretory pathway pseudopilin PulG
MRPRSRSKRGQSLVEISVVFAVSAILAGVGYSAASSYQNLKIALQASSDLRTIEQAQKVAVINGLDNPPSLSGYGTSDWPVTLANLEANSLIDPTLSVIENNWTVNMTTIPPILAIDAHPGLIDNPFAGVPKNPDVNQSGDGMFDVGHDTYYNISSLIH